jgi:hypothetical protein
VKVALALTEMDKGWQHKPKSMLQLTQSSGTLRKKSESGIFGTHFLKMQILRFHDLIAKIGIAKIRIAKIRSNFSDPS